MSGRIEHGTQDNPEIVTEVDGSNNWEVRDSNGNNIVEMQQDGTVSVQQGHLELQDTNRQTLSGDLTLSATDAQIQNIDPGGANRTITLPAEANGLEFIIGNRADATEDLTVNDDSGTTIATINQDDVGRFISDGTGWIGFSAAGGVT